MLEIVLTREDANTEYALLAEWLVEDRSDVTAGQPVCVVETTKATVEVEAPGAGTLVQLYDDGVEVELGKTIAYVAESVDELATIEAKAEEKPAKPPAGDRKATRKALELAELHGIDLSAVEKRGFITEKDVETLIAAQKASESPAAGPALAGVSPAGVSLPSMFEIDESAGTLDPAFLESLDHDAFRALSSAEKRLLATRARESGTVSISARGRWWYASS
jgi:pyruvate/2-oxoglutarate dehydrogenase complex dihydrolipoamide acyltransferase (E2) component